MGVRVAANRLLVGAFQLRQAADDFRNARQSAPVSIGRSATWRADRRCRRYLHYLAAALTVTTSTVGAAARSLSNDKSKVTTESCTTHVSSPQERPTTAQLTHQA